MGKKDESKEEKKARKAAKGDSSKTLRNIALGGVGGVIGIALLSFLFGGLGGLWDSSSSASPGFDSSSGAEESPPKFTHASLIDASTMKTLVKDNPAGMLVDFYTPTCPHCKVLAPEFDQAAKILKDKNGAKLAAVDCSLENALCKELDITRYPTMKWFRNGEPVLEYPPKDRVAQKIADWTTWASQPAVHDLGSSQEFESSLGELRASMSATAAPIIIGFEPKDPSQNSRPLLEAFGERHRGKTLFLYVNGEDPTNGGASIIAYGKELANDKPYTGDLTKEALGAWLSELIPKDRWA